MYLYTGGGGGGVAAKNRKVYARTLVDGNNGRYGRRTAELNGYNGRDDGQIGIDVCNPLSSNYTYTHGTRMIRMRRRRRV